MPGDLKNKLLQFTAEPPPGVWEDIASRLDEEFVVSDGVLAEKMEMATVAPPIGMFAKIDAVLHERPRVKVVPMYRRMAVAAAVIGALVVGAVYFFNDNPVEQQELVNNTPVLEDRDETVAPSATHPDRVAGALYAESQPTRPPLQRRGLAGGRNKSIASQASYVDLDIDDPKPVRMVSNLEPVEVAAPPIRDKSGNVIMDPAVISSPNEPYIVVTSPNGNQTKISNKFLSCLSYLNGNYSSSEINYEGQQWKSRFAEWRNKLSEAGFVPGANNFFDIFELQQLISD